MATNLKNTSSTRISAYTATGGGAAITVINDGDYPPTSSTDSARSWDSYHGAVLETDDWVGYTFPTDYTWSQVVFQEGKEYADGGYFIGDPHIEVRVSGVWTTVSGSSITPSYPGAPNSVNFESYQFDFTPITGDGIRIRGVPGNFGGASPSFISCGELDVFGDVPGAATNDALFFGMGV